MPVQEQQPIRIPRQLLIPLLLMGVFFFVLYAQLKQDYILLAFGSVLPFAFLLLSRLDLLFMSVIAFYFSELTIRYLPMNLMLYQICMIMYVALAAAQRIVGKKRVSVSPCLIIGWAFIAWIFLLIHVRGHAMSFLGSSQVGGAAYIHTFIAFGFYVFAGYGVLTEKQWRLSIIVMIEMMFLIFFLNMTVILTHGKFWYPLIFMKPNFGLMDTFIGFAGGEKTTRWSVAGPLVTLYLIPAFMWPFSGKSNYFKYTVFVLLSLTAALISGGRFHLITLVYFISIFSVLSSKKPFKTGFFLVLTGGIILAVLVVLAPLLPYGAQRTLSMIPGAQVSAAAKMSAHQTMTWRFELWHMFIENLHKYLIVGRGFGFSESQHIQALMSYSFNSLWRQVYSTYIGGHSHQGILDLVFFLGLPGALLFLLWIFAEAIRHIRLHYSTWFSPAFRQYHLALTAFFLTHVLQHLTIHGGIRTFLAKLIFFMALLQAIVISDKRLKNKEKTRNIEVIIE